MEEVGLLQTNDNVSLRNSGGWMFVSQLDETRGVYAGRIRHQSSLTGMSWKIIRL